MGPRQKTGSPRKTIAQKQLELRGKIWPDIDEAHLWLRSKRDGFITIPRCMPIIIKIMDDMSSGKPLGATYIDLWCRSFDECFVVLNKQQEMAYSSGFTGQRSLDAWRGRMKMLHKLDFINTKSGPTGELSYAIILNPYLIIKRHREITKNVSDANYHALLARASEIGANDLD